MISILLFLSLSLENHRLHYGSIAQIKNSYTNAKLSILKKSSHQNNSILQVQASKSEADEWYWTIDSKTLNGDRSYEAIKCGSLISIRNQQYDCTIWSDNSTFWHKKIYCSKYQNTFQSWKVICQTGAFLSPEMKVQIYNIQTKCYLSTMSRFPITFDTPFEYQTICSNNTKNSVWEIDEGIYYFEDNQLLFE